VLGVDPGTVVTGYGVVDGGGRSRAQLVECGVIRPARGAALPVRLADIYDGVCELISRHQPTVVALESVFLRRNVHSTVTLGQAHGVILLAAAQAEVTIARYPPATVKKAVVGTGRAGKRQVGYMVAQLLSLAAPPAPADAADGVAVALTHLLRRQ
jgi:crossover junction endodeoxyribonuclease RuvC